MPTNHPLGIECVALRREPTREEPLRLIRAEQAVTEQFHVLCYPENLLWDKSLPAMGTDSLLQKLSNRIRCDHRVAPSPIGHSSGPTASCDLPKGGSPSPGTSTNSVIPDCIEPSIALTLSICMAASQAPVNKLCMHADQSVGDSGSERYAGPLGRPKLGKQSLSCCQTNEGQQLLLLLLLQQHDINNRS